MSIGNGLTCEGLARCARPASYGIRVQELPTLNDGTRWLLLSFITEPGGFCSAIQGHALPFLPPNIPFKHHLASTTYSTALIPRRTAKTHTFLSFLHPISTGFFIFHPRPLWCFHLKPDQKLRLGAEGSTFRGYCLPASPARQGKSNPPSSWRPPLHPPTPKTPTPHSYCLQKLDITTKPSPS